MATKKAAQVAHSSTDDTVEAPAAAPKKTRKPKAANDAPPAPEPETADAPVAESVIDHIPLSLLQRAPENVRVTAIDEAVAELADDIAAHGLLQSLIGYRAEASTDAPVYICGGGRRLQALLKLLDDGRVGAEYTVPVLLRPQVEAVELSLAENLARRDMNPADEFAAFDMLMQGGTWDASTLAKRFGFTTRYVKQRLRLAELAPEILAALRDKQITLDAAMAYASTSNRELQSKVFKAHSKKGPWDAHKAERIRRDYASEGMRETDPLFVFLGAEAYEAAGGTFDEDLFSEGGDDRALALPGIVRDLVRDKVATAMEAMFASMREQVPSLAGWILLPDLRVYNHGYHSGKDPVAPEGFKWANRYDHAPMWKTIVNNNIAAHAVVGINDDGELVQVVRHAMVPPGQYNAVTGFVDHSDPEEAARRQAEREKLERENRVRIIAAQLAHNANMAAGIEGRRFWARHLYLREMTHPDLGAGFSLEQNVFVTEAEIQAQMETAEAEFDRLVAERQAEQDALAKAQEAAEQAHAEEVAQLLAMDPPPAVIKLDGIVYFRHDDLGGAYLEPRPDEPGADMCDDGFNDLEGSLDYANRIDGFWVSLEAYDTEHPAKPGGADEPDVAADADSEDEVA